jgi:hypothetical protein
MALTARCAASQAHGFAIVPIICAGLSITRAVIITHCDAIVLEWTSSRDL